MPAEPDGLRERGRRLAAEFPEETRLLLAGGEWVAGWIWADVAPLLEPAGAGREDLVAQAARCQRELWLWLAGDRTWEEVAGLLVGGTLRRVGVSPSSPPPPQAGSG